MVPARRASAASDARRRRGWSASRWSTARPGSSAIGIKNNLWAPAAVGPRFRSRADQPEVARAVPRSSSPSSATLMCDPRSRSPRRRSAAIISARAPCFSRRPIRSRPRAATSMRRRRSTSSTRSGSARTRRSRRCSCASRTSTRPAAAATGTLRLHRRDQLGRADQPLPMIRDPRVVFDQLFGVLGSVPRRRSARTAGTRISASSTAAVASRAA